MAPVLDRVSGPIAILVTDIGLAVYAQHPVKGNGKTLNRTEACAYKKIKAELERKNVPESFAPYIMAIIKKKTR